MKLLVLLSLLIGICAVHGQNGTVVLCYYGTWATWRPTVGQFNVDAIDARLCSHIVYAFAGIDENGTMISLDPYLDLPGEGNRDNFRLFTGLKSQNPDLKALLAVGGWNEGSARYSEMAASPILRQNFIQSALTMILDHNFDGLDLDWEYPNRRDTVHGEADIENFNQLLRELRVVFDQNNLLLTAAVSAVESAASLSYDIPTISCYLDFVNVMTYDMHGAWDTETGHNAALHRGEGDEGIPRETLFTVDVAVEYWLREGCPPEKLVMGVPFYGRTFRLLDPAVNGVRAPTNGSGLAGPYTGEAGYMGYNEFCVELLSGEWTVRNDTLARVPYAFRDSYWVTFDNAESIRTKAEYARSLNVAGIMTWSIETDDFHNSCGGGRFPLLMAMNDGIGREIPNSATGFSSSSIVSVFRWIICLIVVLIV